MNTPNPYTFEPTYRCLLRPEQELEIVLVGCGGTGSHLAQAIGATLWHLQAQGKRVPMVTFVDGDHVEMGNVGRQRFCAAEIGRNKAETLANRLNAAYGLKVRAIPKHLTVETYRYWFGRYAQEDRRLIIGCVDNAAARLAIANIIGSEYGRTWWLDCGNAEFNGQILIGNRCQDHGITPPELAVGLWHNLPAPHWQEPALLDPDNDPEPQHTCTVAVATDEQSLMVNSLSASIASQYLYQWTVQRELFSFGTYFGGQPPLMRSSQISKSQLTPYVTAFSQEAQDEQLNVA